MAQPSAPSLVLGKEGLRWCALLSPTCGWPRTPLEWTSMLSCATGGTPVCISAMSFDFMTSPCIEVFPIALDLCLKSQDVHLQGFWFWFSCMGAVPGSVCCPDYVCHIHGEPESDGFFFILSFTRYPEAFLSSLSLYSSPEDTF